MTWIRLVFLSTLLLAVFASLSVAGQQSSYIVPIWVHGHIGVDGYWYSRVLVSNPNAEPVEVRVTELYPLVDGPCAEPDCETSFMIAPLKSALLIPQRGTGMTAGSFTFTSTLPVAVEETLFASGQRSFTTSVGASTEWIEPYQTAWFNDVMVLQGRCNLLVTNPNDTDLSLQYSFAGQWPEQQQIVVPAHALYVHQIVTPTCGGRGCVFPPGFPPSGLRLDVQASGSFYAIASCSDFLDTRIHSPVISAR